MKKEYRKIMESIILSDEEKAKILIAAENKADQSKSYLKAVLVSICVLLFVFLGYRLNMKINISDADSHTMIPNPMQRYDDIEAAEEAAGFTVKVPILDSIESIFVINGEIIQIKGLYESQIITYRMGRGSDDISGDFNEYEQENKLKIADTEIIIKGNDELILLALWHDEAFTYSLSSQGLTSESISLLIDSMTTAVK